MTYEVLKVNVTEGIATVTISRPQALNALNTRFFQEMDSLIAEIGARNDIKVVVITGEGKAFVAGADIGEMVHKTKAEGAEFSKAGQKTLRSLEILDKPVIAAVNGFALGGGLELALACDFRVSSSKAKFGQPEVNLGVIPGYAATQRLPRLIGLGNALFILLTGEMIGAEEALRMGLVQKVVEPEELMPTVLGLAKTIASKGPKAVKLVKSVSRRGFLMDFEAGCALESETFGSLFENEAAEGMRAFLEKRPPKWQG
ncbi:MAG: enoyl-CoA hydratase-related protein [Candidatus Aminicenantes bacterium]|jgi:enoyl-CoA hydratase|nr:enoyl-CoA hydratase-related protein [Candidatus Aminicenantes bacterium]